MATWWTVLMDGILCFVFEGMDLFFCEKVIEKQSRRLLISLKSDYHSVMCIEAATLNCNCRSRKDVE